MAINNHFMGRDIVKDLSKFFHSQYFFISIRIIQLKANLFPNYVSLVFEPPCFHYL